MTDPAADHTPAFPRGPLYAAAAMLLVTLVSVGMVRATGVEIADAPASSVASRDLRFDDRDDGAITVVDAASGQVVDVLEPGTNGFMRSTLRGLARERKRRGIEAKGEVPFRLAQRANGHLTLEDPATGRLVDLGAFGPTNMEVFARYVAAADPARRS